MSEWVYWVRACIRIAMRWVTLWKSLLTFLPLARKMHFPPYYVYTSFQVARSMWQFTIHHSFHPSPVFLLVAISGSMCAQLTMFPMLKTCKATAAGAFLTIFNTESKLPEFSGLVVSARAHQYTTKAPSSFRSLILNSRCSSYGRRPFGVPRHLPGRFLTHTQLFRRSPLRQLGLPVHRHNWDMRSASKPSTWTIIPCWIQSSIACRCSSDIDVLLWLISLMNSRVPQSICHRMSWVLCIVE